MLEFLENNILANHLLSVVIGCLVVVAIVHCAIYTYKKAPSFYTWLLFGTSFAGVCELIKLTGIKII